MVGQFFSRGFVKSARKNGTSVFSRSSNANASRSRVNGSLQRKIHSSSRRRLPTLSALNCQATFSKSFPVALNNGSLLAHIQASGLHMTCCSSAVSTEDSSGTPRSEISSSESPECSDGSADPLLNNVVTSEYPGETLMSSPFETAQDIVANGIDVPLSTLGLGGYTPIGMIQHCLDFAHCTLGLPWWGAIVAGTVIFRILVFPLMVKGQVNAARLNAIKPELDRLQQKLREVSNLQNPMSQAAVSMELQQLFKNNNCHPVKAIISPLVQLPLFISFFIGLRRMSYLPIESMKTGGIFWFQDLTLADPYFILPVFCAATMLLTIETGAEVGMSNPNMQTMKNVFRGMCVLMVPLTYTFPTAIFTYWITSNFISLGQVFLLKQPAMKQYFGLPDFVPPPQDPNAKNGGFFENLKAGYKNAQEAAYVKNADKMREISYKSSLKDVYQETFEYNPRIKENDQLFEKAKSSSKK